MASTFKSLEIARTLQSKLKIRQSAKTHDVSFDTDGNPLVYFDDGSPATTEANALIKIMPIDWPLATDVLGNAARQYAPHKVMLAMEAPASGTGQTFASLQILTDILGECMALGCRFEWWQETNGSVPATTTFDTASKKKATYFPDLYNPLTSQM